MTSSLPAEDNYAPAITTVRAPEARKLLQTYAKIPEDEVVDHVNKMRDKAWKICPYGCVGRFGFTIPSIQTHPQYRTLLHKLNSGSQLLDLGCGFGQNMRKLVLDGAPRSSVYGADISSDLIDCGYEYFRDTATPFQTFTGDILGPPSPSFTEREGAFDILWTALFFHLWDYKNQLKASLAAAKFLKPVPGSTLTGWQLGASPATEIKRNLGEERKEHTTMFRHDEKSFTRMWEEVGEELGMQFRVEAENTLPSWMQHGDGLKQNEGSRNDVITFTVVML